MKLLDISHWNLVKDWKKVRSKGYECVILKCTEATYYKDPTFEKYRQGARDAGMLVGAYHFARGGDARKEAAYFVKNVGAMRKGELLALDWEINHSNPVSWSLAFLKEVERLVGFKPLFYTNSARLYAHDWTPVVQNDNGLWVAQYGLNICTTLGRSPKIGKWPFYAIWQYCSRGAVEGIYGKVDLNYSKANLDTLKKYGKK